MVRIKWYAKLFVFALFVFLLLLIIKGMAESRSKDFFIDNYFLEQGIYTSEDEAQKNIDIDEINWGFRWYCVVAVVYLDHGGSRISTSIPLRVPVLPYALNMRSAKEGVEMVGTC